MESAGPQWLRHSTLSELARMTEARRDKLNAMDWMGVATLAIEALVLVVSRVYTSKFTEVFSEFGGDLTVLTKIVLSPVYGAIAAALLLLCASAMWWPALRGRQGTKRTFLVIGFVFGLGTIGLYVIGLYLPIFTMADLASQQ
jgi:hypothetical protein